MANNKKYSKNGKSRNRKSNYNKAIKTDNWQDAAELKAEIKSSRDKGTRKVPIDTKSSDNDPNWYAVNPSILRDAASYPYARPTGLPIYFDPVIKPTPTGSANPVTEISPTVVPGIMTFHWCPTVGGANSAVDAVNIAANSIYSFVRHANSGHSNYDAPDLMNYILAMDSAYSFYAHMVRIYGLMNNYALMNKYTPQAILWALGADFENLQSDMANFRAYINQYAYRLSSLAMPSDIYYITRHIWMNENVYMDAETPKAQYYAYVQDVFMFWLEGSGDVLGQLYFSNIPTTTRTTTSGGRAFNLSTLSDYISFGNKLLNPIIGSEDMNIMSGDILKAFGEGALFKVLPISETYFISPVYNQEVLSQMENIETPPSAMTTQNINGGDNPFSNNVKMWAGNIMTSNSANYPSHIIQNSDVNNGYLVENIRVSIPAGIGQNATNNSVTISPEQYLRSSKHILNMHKEAITPEDTMVASRLMINPSTKMTYSTTQQLAIVDYPKHAYGSEIVVRCQVTAFVDNVDMGSDASSGASLSYFWFGSEIVFNTADLNTSNAVCMNNVLAVISKFDWHPKVCFAVVNTDSSTPKRWSWKTGTPLYDYCVTATIDSENLSLMHETALLSELNCQRMGAFSPKA